MNLFLNYEIVNVTSLSHAPIVKDPLPTRIYLEQNARLVNLEKKKSQ